MKNSYPIQSWVNYCAFGDAVWFFSIIQLESLQGWREVIGGWGRLNTFGEYPPRDVWIKHCTIICSPTRCRTDPTCRICFKHKVHNITWFCQRNAIESQLAFTYVLKYDCSRLLYCSFLLCFNGMNSSVIHYHNCLLVILYARILVI